MIETTILIPDEAEYTRLFTCVFEPAGSKTQIEVTFDGEDIPFMTGKTSNRSNEIGIFMRRPRRLDKKSKSFTKPLKDGDIVNVKVTHQNGTIAENKVTIKETKKG